MAPENLDRQLVQINDPHSRSGFGGVHNHALVMCVCDVLNHLQPAFLEVDAAPPERQGFAATHSGMDRQMDEREERMLLPFSQLQEVADGLNIRRHHLLLHHPRGLDRRHRVAPDHFKIDGVFAGSVQHPAG